MVFVNGNTLIINNYNVTDDAYVWNEYPDSNYGNVTGNRLRINPKTTSTKEGIIRFNISFIDSSWTITRVIFNTTLYNNYLDAGEYSNISIHHVYNTYLWNTTGIVWNNRPTASSDINLSAENTIQFTDTGEFECSTCFYSWNITDMFNYEINNSSNYLSFYLKGVGTGGVTDNLEFLQNTPQAGGENSVQLIIEYTSSKPTTNLISPSNGTKQTTNNITFECNGTSGTAVGNLTLYHDITSSFIANYTNITGGTNTTGYLSYFVSSVDDGTYHWNCYVCADDDTCTWGGFNYSVSIDTINPLIDYISPTKNNNTFQNKYSYYINLSYTEINKDKVYLMWNNSFNTSATCTSTSCWINKSGTCREIFVGNNPVCFDIYNKSACINYGDCYWENLFDASYSYQVFINDTFGRYNLTEVRYITFDTTFPIPTILHPLAQNYNYNTSIQFNWSVTETNLEKVWYNLDNGPNTTLTGNITFNVTTGTHTLYLFSNDSAVNYNFTSVIFEVNLDNPAISLDFPSNGSWLNYNSIIFNSTASDSSLSTCELWGDFDGTFSKNQTNIAPKNYTTMNWSVVSLNDGTYHWNVWCNDTSNNAATGLFNYTVYVDTTYPQIHTESNYPTTMYNNYSLVLNITATDANIKTVWLETNATGSWKNYTMNNVSSNYYFELSSGNFSNQLNITYRFFVNDSATNLNITSWYSLFVNNRQPSIPTIITTNNTQRNVNSIMLNFSGSDADSDSLTYYVWEGNGSFIGSSNTTGFNWTGLSDGIYKWNVFSSDGYVNSSRSENQTFVIDTTYPTYTITNPENESSVLSLSIDLKYSVEDNNNYTSCWYSVVVASSNVVHIANTTLSICNSTEVTETITVGIYSSFNLNFYVNDTSNNINKSIIYFTTKEPTGTPSSGGGQSPSSSDDDVITEPIMTQAPVCGNGVCETTEDLINCPIDCPLNLDTLMATLQQAWFAKFAFFFIISAIVYLAYKDSTKKYTKQFKKYIPKTIRKKYYKRRR